MMNPSMVTENIQIFFLSHFISKGLFEVFEKPALTHILLA